MIYQKILKHSYKYGLITVESEPDAGATFTIYLPALLPEKSDLQKTAEKSVTKIPVEQPDKDKILLMDDEEAIRNFMGLIIKRLGYDVETCTEGTKAVEIYTKAMESNKPFNAVILDLTNQLGMGGKETMEKLLEIDPDVKGIIITGYYNDPVVTNYKAYGFSGYLTKPATRDELDRIISEVLSSTV